MVYKYVYKIVAALVGLSIIPIVLFTPMFYIMGNVAIGDAYIYEDMSLYEMYMNFIRPNGGLSALGGMELSEPVRATMPYLITAGAFLALAVLLGVAIAVTAFACKSRLPVLVLAVAGIMSMIAVFRFFGRFALPYTDGTIGVGDFGLLGDGILNGLLGAVVQLKSLKLSTAASFTRGAHIIVLLWTIAFMVVDIGDKDTEKKKPAHGKN